MENAQSQAKNSTSIAMDNCSFDILTQAEKKADFLHSAIDTYIDDANAANRQDLVKLWNTIKQDERRHLDLLKQELAKELQQGRLK
jgi:rubrerythrin